MVRSLVIPLPEDTSLKPKQGDDLDRGIVGVKQLFRVAKRRVVRRLRIFRRVPAALTFLRDKSRASFRRKKFVLTIRLGGEKVTVVSGSLSDGGAGWALAGEQGTKVFFP
jgi:hypothetical protein